MFGQAKPVTARLSARWDRWRNRPIRLRFWREFVYVGLFDLVYEWTSDYAGTSRSLAYRNALSQLRVEHALGLQQEHTIQAWALHSRVLIEQADLFYATVHFVAPVAALIWLFKAHPERYLRCRDVLAWTTGLALGCFALYPLMPPRMLPSGYGVIDTMARIGGPGSWDTVLLKDAGNQFAAMPSLHIAWCLWVTLSVYPVVRSRWMRALLVADPVLTTVSILVSGNHYVLDIFGGVAVLAAGYGLAALTPRFLPRRLAAAPAGRAVEAEPALTGAAAES